MEEPARDSVSQSLGETHTHKSSGRGELIKPPSCSLLTSGLLRLPSSEPTQRQKAQNLREPATESDFQHKGKEGIYVVARTSSGLSGRQKSVLREH